MTSAEILFFEIFFMYPLLSIKIFTLELKYFDELSDTLTELISSDIYKYFSKAKTYLIYQKINQVKQFLLCQGPRKLT